MCLHIKGKKPSRKRKSLYRDQFLGLANSSEHGSMWSKYLEESYTAFLKPRATRLSLQTLQYFFHWFVTCTQDEILLHGLYSLPSHHALFFGQIWEHKIIKPGDEDPDWVTWDDIFKERREHFYAFLNGSMSVNYSYVYILCFVYIVAEKSQTPLVETLQKNPGFRDWQSYIEFYALLFGCGQICRTVIEESANVDIKTEFKKEQTTLDAHKFAFFNEYFVKITKLFSSAFEFGNPYDPLKFNELNMLFELIENDDDIKTIEQQNFMLDIHEEFNSKCMHFQRVPT